MFAYSTLVQPMPSYQNMPWFAPIAPGSDGGGGGGGGNVLITSDTETMVDDAGNQLTYEEIP
jgi:hypothetical protein